MSMNEKELVKLAIMAKENSYAPYSNFHVGACLLSKSGKTYLGCNVENASYGACNCAERTAIFSAVANGEREFEAIAIVGSNCNDYCFPCGICRQVMSEFGNFKVIVIKNENDYKVYRVNDLLPESFNKDNM